MEREMRHIYQITIFYLLIALPLIIINCGENNPTGTDSPDSIYVLVWSDEFNSDVIDPNKWEYEVNADGGGNNELQYYTDRLLNSWIEDTVLVIQALKENYTGPGGTREYTSARMRTKNKGDWKYGKFEIRAKLPYGKGLWPAIWLLPTDWVYGGWAASGEIDIMELIGNNPAKVYGTLHYGGTYPANVHTGASYVLSEGTFASDYHIFTLEWEPTQMRWYVDGLLYQTQTAWYTEGHNYPAPFDQRFHLILNVAVGGNWPGNPDETTLFPQQMEVDYVRVYQKQIRSN
jgi:beta-glucanase (GH16 family)